MSYDHAGATGPTRCHGPVGPVGAGTKTTLRNLLTAEIDQRRQASICARGREDEEIKWRYEQRRRHEEAMKASEQRSGNHVAVARTYEADLKRFEYALTILDQHVHTAGILDSSVQVGGWPAS